MKSSSLLYRFFRASQSALLPFVCCLCSVETQQSRAICFACEQTLPWSCNRCYRCGIYLATEAEAIFCEQCFYQPPAYDRLCTVFAYTHPINILIRRLKFYQKLYLARLFRDFLLNDIQHRWYRNTPLPQAIIPVPLHRKRLKKRGYNQAYELVRGFARKFNRPVLWKHVIRTKATKAQSKLSLSQRKRNVAHAFKIIKPIPYPFVVIVDDVVTSGATVSALAKTLKQAGVQTVEVWCIARA